MKSLKGLILLLVLFAAIITASGCGKKGPPAPPDEARYFRGF